MNSRTARELVDFIEKIQLFANGIASALPDNMRIARDVKALQTIATDLKESIQGDETILEIS